MIPQFIKDYLLKYIWFVDSVTRMPIPLYLALNLVCGWTNTSCVFLALLALSFYSCRVNLIKKLSWSNNSDKPWTFLWGKRTDLFLFLIKPLWIWVWLLCSPVQLSFYSGVKGGMSPFISSELGAWMQSWALVKFVTYMAYYIWLLYTFSYFELYYLLFWLLLDFFFFFCDSVPHLFLKELGRSHFVIRDWILPWWLAGHFILTLTLAILKASFLSFILSKEPFPPY